MVCANRLLNFQKYGMPVIKPLVDESWLRGAFILWKLANAANWDPSSREIAISQPPLCVGHLYYNR